MEYIGDTELTYERLEKIITDWTNEGKLEIYLADRYDKWLVSFSTSFAEIFVGNDEVDDYNEHALGYEDTFYIINEALASNGIKLEGEPLSWATDRMIELGFEVSMMSELVPYSKLNLSDIACDDETKKEILSNLKIK